MAGDSVLCSLRGHFPQQPLPGLAHHQGGAFILDLSLPVVCRLPSPSEKAQLPRLDLGAKHLSALRRFPHIFRLTLLGPISVVTWALKQADCTQDAGECGSGIWSRTTVLFSFFLTFLFFFLSLSPFFPSSFLSFWLHPVAWACSKFLLRN